MKRLLFTVLFVLVSSSVAFSTDTTSSNTVPASDSQQLSEYYQFKIDSMAMASQAERSLMVASGRDVHPSIPFIGVLIPVIFILAFAFILYNRINATKQVRLQMIANGMDPGMLNVAPDENSRKYSALRYGLLFCGLGLGFLIAIIIISVSGMHDETGVFVTLASVLLGGGLGLVSYHRFVSNADKTS